VALVILIWGLVASTGMISENKLPPPWKVMKAFGYLAWDGQRGESLLLTATLWSLMRVTAAGVLVVAIGVPIGVMMGVAPKINAVLSPLIDPFRSAPVVAFLPLFVMWFGIHETMKILFLFTGAVVYLIPMVRDAVRAVPEQYWISARDIGAKAEYVNAEKGLGQLIQNARRFSAMDQVIAGIMMIIALALVTYYLLRTIRTRLFGWETQV